MTRRTDHRVPSLVRGRDGTLVAFDSARISSAVMRAAREVDIDGEALSAAVTREVVADLSKRFAARAPGVEDIEDAVQQQLTVLGPTRLAGAYAGYRARRAELREAKARLGVRDELKLSLAAVTVLRERYLRRNRRGRTAESTGEMMDRVALHVAAAEDMHRPGGSARWAPQFSALMRSLDFHRRLCHVTAGDLGHKKSSRRMPRVVALCMSLMGIDGVSRRCWKEDRLFAAVPTDQVMDMFAFSANIQDLAGARWRADLQPWDDDLVANFGIEIH